MSPAELAQRIAALDWSATSLQHQLAVSAACLILERAPADAFVAALSDLPLATNIVPLPVRKRTCWTTLCHLDGREWARSSHFGPGGAWEWIVESVAHEHGVSDDQIRGEEGEDGEEFVTVDGLRLYRIEHVSN